jgi:hypothetical protein
MKTINFPRRAMRPPPGKDDLPEKCAWCGNPVGRGVVFALGKDLGKVAIVCGDCLTPPKPGERPAELTSEE